MTCLWWLNIGDNVIAGTGNLVHGTMPEILQKSFAHSKNTMKIENSLHVWRHLIVQGAIIP